MRGWGVHRLQCPASERPAGQHSMAVRRCDRGLASVVHRSKPRCHKNPRNNDCFIPPGGEAVDGLSELRPALQHCLPMWSPWSALSISHQPPPSAVRSCCTSCQLPQYNGEQRGPTGRAALGGCPGLPRNHWQCSFLSRAILLPCASRHSARPSRARNFWPHRLSKESATSPLVEEEMAL